MEIGPQKRHQSSSRSNLRKLWYGAGFATFLIAAGLLRKYLSNRRRAQKEDSLDKLVKHFETLDLTSDRHVLALDLLRNAFNQIIHYFTKLDVSFVIPNSFDSNVANDVADEIYKILSGESQAPFTDQHEPLDVFRVFQNMFDRAIPGFALNDNSLFQAIKNIMNGNGKHQIDELEKLFKQKLGPSLNEMTVKQMGCIHDYFYLLSLISQKTKHPNVSLSSIIELSRGHIVKIFIDRQNVKEVCEMAGIDTKKLPDDEDLDSNDVLPFEQFTFEEIGLKTAIKRMIGEGALFSKPFKEQCALYLGLEPKPDPKKPGTLPAFEKSKVKQPSNTNGQIVNQQQTLKKDP